jgi:hypothetical protein
MSSPQWCFADFRLDPDNACLWRGTQPLALTPKAFDVLQYLVTHPDRLVTKGTLLDAVWPETAISEAVVRIAIGELRRVLGDTAQAPRFIATVAMACWSILAIPWRMKTTPSGPCGRGRRSRPGPGPARGGGGVVASGGRGGGASPRHGTGRDGSALPGQGGPEPAAPPPGGS